MMGGATLYCDGTVFAILAFDELWFKADAESDAAWDAAGDRGRPAGAAAQDPEKGLGAPHLV